MTSAVSFSWDYALSWNLQACNYSWHCMNFPLNFEFITQMPSILTVNVLADQVYQALWIQSDSLLLLLLITDKYCNSRIVTYLLCKVLSAEFIYNISMFFFCCADMTCLYFDLLLFISSVRLAFALPLSFFIFPSSSVLILLSISLSSAHTHCIAVSVIRWVFWGVYTKDQRELRSLAFNREMLHCKTQRKITRDSESDASDATK